MNTKTHSTDAASRAAERHFSMNRRKFLRGLGVGLALPMFESFKPFGALAADGSAAAGSAASGAPMRMAFVYFPNGAIQKNWWPEESDSGLKLARTLQPLESVKDNIQVVSGLDHVHATPGPDGAGDHARASGTFLTGVRVKKTAGSDIRAGVSIDQLVAQKIGHLTRFPSLELTCDNVRKSGSCDSGYSCAYQYNLSWRSSAVPVAPESNPRLVFERLFGAGAHGERNLSLLQRRAQQRSVLDFVLEDAKELSRDLSSRDRAKLDEYLTSVREIEKRIAQAEKFTDVPDPKRETPAGVPKGFGEHLDLMFDLLALSFQTDSTRVATFLMANDGSNRAFPEIGIPEGHHYLSHHMGKADMIEKVGEIDLWYAKHFAAFLEKLKNSKDTDGRSILDNSMIVYGCGNSDGNRHTHSNLPIVLAGGGGGALKGNRFVKAGGVPMSNLFLTMADRMGATGLERFGDSTGRLTAV